VLGLVKSIDWGTNNGTGNEFGNGDDTITTGIGRDMIFGGGGDDVINAYASSGGTADLDGNNIVFGDHGLVDYLAEEREQNSASNPVRTTDIDRIWSIAAELGGADEIKVGDANDIVLGGTGDDVIHAGHGKNVVFGDNGQLTAATTDDPLMQVSVHEFTIGEIISIAFADGGVDEIWSGGGDDIIIGGRDGDTIDAGHGDNVVFGDHGQILMITNQGFNRVIGAPARPTDDHPLTYALITSLVPASEIGGADTITTGIGRDIVIGGAGADVINTFASTSLGTTAAGIASQDRNNIVFGDYGLVDYLSEELLQSDYAGPLDLGNEDDLRTLFLAYVRSADPDTVAGGPVNNPNPIRAADIDRIWSIATATSLGGNDTIITGDANDIVLGGTGNDLDRRRQWRQPHAIGRQRQIDSGDVRLTQTAVYSVHEFTICRIETIGFEDADSGNDTIIAGRWPRPAVRRGRRRHHLRRRRRRPGVRRSRHGRVRQRPAF
jgi:Ca2+-binding RTX toxin-like protein